MLCMPLLALGMDFGTTSQLSSHGAITLAVNDNDGVVNDVILVETLFDSTRTACHHGLGLSC